MNLRRTLALTITLAFSVATGGTIIVQNGTPAFVATDGTIISENSAPATIADEGAIIVEN